jgi:hypothetical protein
MLAHNVPQNNVRRLTCLRTNFVYYTAGSNNEVADACEQELGHAKI